MTVNPFLFLLLKKLVLIDTCIFTHRSKISYVNVTDYIKSIADFFEASNGNTLASSTFAEHVRKALSAKDFDFDLEFLDMLAQCIKSNGRYTNWEDFKAVHGINPHAVYCEQYTGPYSLESIDTKIDIEKRVDRVIYFIFKLKKGNSTPHIFPPDYHKLSSAHRIALKKKLSGDGSQE